MNERQAIEAVGERAHVVARYAVGGGIHAEGRIIGYCDAPTVIIEQADGSRVSWRADMTQLRPSEDQRRRAALFNDITHAADHASEHVLLSDRKTIADHLWEQGWRRDVRPEDVTERRDSERMGT